MQLPVRLGQHHSGLHAQPGDGGWDVQFQHEGLARSWSAGHVQPRLDQYVPSLRGYIETGTDHPFGMVTAPDLGPRRSPLPRG